MSATVQQRELSASAERVLVAVERGTGTNALVSPTFVELIDTTQLLAGDAVRALRQLERQRLLEGGKHPSLPFRYQYRLTQAGRELYPEAARRLAKPRPSAPRLRPSSLAELAVT